MFTHNFIRISTSAQEPEMEPFNNCPFWKRPLEGVDEVLRRCGLKSLFPKKLTIERFSDAEREAIAGLLKLAEKKV